MQKKRPKHLNLIKIKLPLPGVISIIHRVSGALLFFPGIPALLYGLQLALGSPQSHEELKALLQIPLVKLALMLPLWFFLHHCCAGIRYLALDLQYGIALEQARISSMLVLAAGIIFTLLIGAAIW